MKCSASRISTFVLLLITFVAPSVAQVATGIPPFASLGGGPFDVINLGNLNVHLSVPVRHKAGRGIPFTFGDLTYDSSVWQPVTSAGTKSWQPVTANGVYWGWQGFANAGSAYISYAMSYTSGNCGTMGQSQYQEWTYTNFVYHDQFGTSHYFNYSDSYLSSPGGSSCPPNGAEPPTPLAVTTTDGSGYTLTVNPSAGAVSAYVTTNKGTTTITPPVYTNPSGQQGTLIAQDSNGNKITVANGAYKDTLGQTVLTVVGSAPSNTTLSYAAPSGAQATYTVSYKSYAVQTNFGCAGVVEYNNSTIYLVDKITLPDTTYYQFTYEGTPGATAAQVTGRLASITLPTGGTISYSYRDGSNGIECEDGSTAGIVRTVNPGGQWTYDRSGAGNNSWNTSVAAPDGSWITLALQKDSSTVNPTNEFYETLRNTPDGSTSSTVWNGGFGNGIYGAVSSPITQKDYYFSLDSGTYALVEEKYNTYGLVTDTKQYDWGAAYLSAPSGAYLQDTSISYLSLGGGILLPSSVTVTDGNSNILSKTTTVYDEYSTYPLQPTTGTPNHVSVTGARGNATTIKTYVTSSSFLTKHFSYFDTGNIQKAYDVNGSITTYVYGTATQGNSTVSCGNSFATTINLPISGLSGSSTWDCNGGVATSSTDANGKTSTVNYTDALFWRPATVVDQASNTTSFGYKSATKTEAWLTFNNGTSITDQLTTADGFGRPTLWQRRQSPTSNNYDTTQASYDALGRQSEVTMSYVGTIYQTTTTTPTTTTTYDGIGRVIKVTDGGTGYVAYTYSHNDVLVATGPAPTGEHLKQKQLEYDALGRLTSVCEITTQLPGYASCGQTTAASGYLTTYVYDFYNGYSRMTVTQHGQQTRIFLYDLLGRLVSENNPESQTTSYIYDTTGSSSCNSGYSSGGDQVRKVDANGTNTCYYYDSLHRLTDVGTNRPAVDGCKRYRYDNSTGVLGARPTGVSVGNTLGRLVEAETDTCAQPITQSSIITDEWLTYSVRGELTEQYQSTPHSGGYYHPTAAYWPNGALQTLWISGLPSISYGVDGEGRTSAVSASSGQNPVTSTAYNLSAFTSTVTYGSSDSDAFTLDPQTGRMKQYKFTVGSQSLTGNLNWNQNGSLASLDVTNQLNAADNQTCTYAHDDLARIASVNCGASTWSQQFTYDAFGNITKTVPTGSTGVAFSPGYSTTTNQITSLPGVTPTYDADGQPTYDGTHNYAWDATSKILSVDSTTLIYDAFGRMVEKAIGSAYTQYVYSPTGGKFALMSGQTFLKAYVPLPDGQAVYTSSGLAYYRHGDQRGSSRLASTPTRALYSSSDYGPFGESYAQAGTSDLSFTGQGQDTTSGLYDFMFRRYNSAQGRWVSPDPAGLEATDPSSPQSWNRYAYVVGNPMVFIDPLGLDCGDEVAFLRYQERRGQKRTADLLFRYGLDYHEKKGDDMFEDCGGGGGGGGGADISGGDPTPPTEDFSGDSIDVNSTMPPDLQTVSFTFGSQLTLDYASTSYSATCSAALATAKKNRGAIRRATNAWSTLQAAAGAHKIDPALLGAIGVRETGFMNIPQTGGGPGMGVFQLTVGPGVTVAQASDLSWAANFAANMLSSNMNYLSNNFPALTSGQLLQATAASFNIGRHGITGNPNTIDRGTTGGNYGSNVVNLMACFSHP